MAERADQAALVRRQALTSAAINAGLSLAFFLLLFGSPNRPLTLGAPDRLALDFVPQAGMIGLMSALVPALVTRQSLAVLRGLPPVPVSRIVRTALGWAAAALVLGAIAAGITAALPVAAVDGRLLLAVKMVCGGLLGAAITRRVLDSQTRTGNRQGTTGS